MALLILSGCSTAHRSGATALQGTWSGREPGVTPEMPRQLVLSGNVFDYRGAHPQDWGKGTFTLREDTEPNQLVVAITQCGFPQYVGTTARLIYKLENGTLTAAASEPGKSAPASFDAADARHMIFTKQ